MPRKSKGTEVQSNPEPENHAVSDLALPLDVSAFLDALFQEMDFVDPKEAKLFFISKRIDKYYKMMKPAQVNRDFIRAAAKAFKDEAEDWVFPVANYVSKIVNRTATNAAQTSFKTLLTWNNGQMLRLITKGFKGEEGSIRGGKRRAEHEKKRKALKSELYRACCAELRVQHPDWSKANIYRVASKRLAKEGHTVSARSLRRYVELPPLKD